MPDLREIFLKERLKAHRFGNPVRAALTPKTFTILTQVKHITQRTYQDLFYAVLTIYKYHPEFFPIVRRRVPRRDIFFRISRSDADTVQTWAWKRNQRRRNFIGDLMERFFELVPIATILDVFRNQKDRLFMIEEELKSHGLKQYSDSFSQALPELSDHHQGGEVSNLPRGHNAPRHPVSDPA